MVYAKETVTKIEQNWPVKDSMSYFVNRIIQVILFLLKNFLQVFRKFKSLIVFSWFLKIKGKVKFWQEL